MMIGLHVSTILYKRLQFTVVHPKHCVCACVCVRVCVCVCVLAVEDVGLVRLVHLLQEDEGEHGVGAEAGVVRSEAFPQREETFRANDSHQHLLMEPHTGSREEEEASAAGTVYRRGSLTPALVTDN